MLTLEGLRRACVDLGTRISDPRVREVNEALRAPLAALQSKVDALPHTASQETLEQMAADLDNLSQQVQ